MGGRIRQRPAEDPDDPLGRGRLGGVPSPSPGLDQNFLHDVAGTASDDVWGVGYYAQVSNERSLAERWDGTSWAIVPTPNVGSGGNRFNGVVALSRSNAWAVGYRTSTDLRTLIQRWNGTSWRWIPSPNVGSSSNFLTDIAAASPTDLWAAGGYSDGTSTRTLVLHLCRG